MKHFGNVYQYTLSVRMRMRMRYGCAGFFVNLMAWNVETPFDSHLIAVLTPANMV